jgi:hypothetical protein
MGVISLMKTFSNNNAFVVSDFLSVTGSVISANRRQLIDQYLETIKSADWLLLLDSDIVITPKDLATLWKNADKTLRPVVSGLYLLIGKPSSGNLTLTPAVYHNDPSGDGRAKPLINFPKDSLVKIDRAGLGCVLIHKSVFLRLREKFGKINLFAERYTEEDLLIGEDFSFFEKVEQAKIPVYAQTSVIAKHLKTVALDAAYHQLFWSKHRIVAE